MKILVTGGAGFIGSHLVERLLEQNNQVIVIDNFNDYYDPAIKEENISEIKKGMTQKDIPEEKLILYRKDIRDKEAVDKIFEDHSIDRVVHLAAMAGVRPSIVDPTLYYDVNMTGTLNLLEASHKHGMKKFVFASSSSVYGNNKKVPFRESDPVDNPISPYASTKKSGELLCHTYYHLYDISMACLRFFTVYGPRQRPDLAIHKFTRMIRGEQPIPFYGDGTTQRDYTYIHDIIDGIIKTIEWIGQEEKQYEIFNLGESQTISLREMVSTIEEVIGKKAELNRLPMQPGDVDRTYADVSKAKRVIGYNPHQEFKEGIKCFVKWLNKEN